MEPVARTRSSTSAPRSRCSAASPLSPASISTSGEARSCSSRARTAPARPRSCAPAPACCRSSRARRRCSGYDLRRPRTAPPSAAGSGCSATPPGCTTTSRVADNVRFWARAGGATRAEADAALAALGLDGRLADVVGRPSSRPASAGGPRSPRLVARRPELWLLDEPHAGLDHAGRDVVDGLIRVGRDAGATVIVASHELERAGALADRTVTIVGGTVVTPPDRPPRCLASTAADIRTERRQTDAGRGHRRCSMFRDAALVAGKDLRVELAQSRSTSTRSRRSPSWCWSCSRSRSTPTAACSTGPRRACSGSRCCSAALLAIQRAFAIEAADGNRDAPAPVGPRPGRHLPGQGRRHRAQLAVLEVLLGSASSCSTAPTWRAGCC